MAAVLMGAAEGRTGESGSPTRLDRATDHILVRFLAPELHRRNLAHDGVASRRRLLRDLGLGSGGSLQDSTFALWAKTRSAKSAIAPDPDTMSVDRYVYLQLPPGLTPEACVERLRGHPLVAYAETDPWGTGGFTPNDQYYATQWHVGGGGIDYPGSPDIHLAWDRFRGTSAVIVAVLDTGIDTNIYDFAGRIVPGYDIANARPLVVDDNGHGTMMAAVLGAAGNNWALGAGVDWNCRLMPVKVLDSNNSGLASWWADGIDWAVANGAKVLNLSAGVVGSNATLHTAITNAVARGAIFVTITHNHPSLGVLYPGSDPASITVGAIDTNATRCFFSAYGSSIDLVAPGTNIYTFGTGGVWNVWGGTSFAAPQVSGVAALLCGLRPELNQEQARALLCAGAEEGGHSDTNDTPGFDIYYGWGRLNALNSLTLAQPAPGTLAMVDGVVQFSWESPGNGSNRTPFRLEYRDSLTAGAWAVMSNVVYTSTNATFTDATVSNLIQRYYRVVVGVGY